MRSEKLCLILLAVVGFACAVLGGYISQDQPFPITSAIEGVIGAFTGTSESASATHWLISLPLGVAVLLLTWRRRVEPLPSPRVSVLALVFGVFILGSVLVSGYKFASLLAACEWLTYILAFYATVATIGRSNGPKLLAASIAAGVAIVALRGILEYTANNDASWRIFAGWVGPNAVAAVLVVGVFVTLGLIESGDRSTKAVAGFGTVLCGSGLWLTQSKGGLLACLLGLAFIILMSLLRRDLARIVTASVIVGVSLGAGYLLQKQQALKLGSSAVTSRVLNSGATQEQSGGYRVNLWKGAATLVVENPIGYGIGTYRFHSAKPGLTPQTQLTHTSFLQLAVEVGPIGAVVFLCFYLAWLVEATKGLLKLRLGSEHLRLCLTASTIAFLTHNLLDSDMYMFGSGMLLFMLMGIGLQLAPDGTTFEFISAKAKASLSACVVVLCVIFGYLAWLDQLPARIIGDSSNPRGGAETLRTWAPFDYRGWYYSGLFTRDADEAVQFLTQAEELGPSPRVLRALARALLAHNEPAKATLALKRALDLDPHNLIALNQLLETQRGQGLIEDASQTAKRLIDVENTPYYLVRAIPEVVPTETLTARRFLADRTTDPKQIVKLLAPALDTYRRYLGTTVPKIKMATQAGVEMPGMSIVDARKSMAEAKIVATTLARIYRELGDSEEAERADADAAAFESASL